MEQISAQQLEAWLGDSARDQPRPYNLNAGVDAWTARAQAPTPVY